MECAVTKEEVVFIYISLVEKIIDDNKRAIKKIACANHFTKYLVNTIPLYLFALNQMKLLSLNLNLSPLSVKIPLAAKWSQYHIKMTDTQISRQLLILEFAGILDLVDSSLIGRFGKFVNTYQIVLLAPNLSKIQINVEKIKRYYGNKSPLAFIRRADFQNF